MNETQLRRALVDLAVAGVPDEEDTWSRIRAAVIARGAPRRRRVSRPRAWRRPGLLAALTLAALFSTAAVAAAASPSFRHFLQTRLPGGPAGQASGGYTQGGVPSLHPLPAFPLYYPAALPHTLAQIHGIARLNSSNGRDVFSAGGNCPPRPAPCTPRLTDAFIPPHPTAGFPSLLIPFARTTTDVVWFGVADFPPRTGFVQVAEWDATRSPLKTLSPGTVPRLHPGRRESLLILTRGRTTIAIDTDLGGALARKVAASLRPFRQPRPPRVRH
jgi:hypothetical protein